MPDVVLFQVSMRNVFPLRSRNSRAFVKSDAARILVSDNALLMLRASPRSRKSPSVLRLIGTAIAAITPVSATTTRISVIDTPRDERSRISTGTTSSSV